MALVHHWLILAAAGVAAAVATKAVMALGLPRFSTLLHDAAASMPQPEPLMSKELFVIVLLAAVMVIQLAVSIVIPLVLAVTCAIELVSISAQAWSGDATTSDLRFSCALVMFTVLSWLWAAF